MNHRWENDTCIKCGLKRQKQIRQRYVYSTSVLRNGVWENKDVFDIRFEWHYGDPHQFDRPDCKPNQKEVINESKPEAFTDR